MSYILDALNKSENERRAGALPGLAAGASFMVAPRQATRRGGAAILVGAGMLVTGLALGNWRPWQPLAVVPPPLELAAAAPVVAPPLLGEAPGKAGAAPASKPAAKPVVQLKPPPAVPASGKPLVPAKAPVTTAIPVQVAAGYVRTPPLKAAAAGGRVVAFRELPPKVKSQLPKIAFGGFAGVDEAEVRIAFINDRLVKEGEEVSPGLKLEKVGNDGVVLGYQGHRFRP
ncbi:MAG: general secretion pathway protein GspB [Dechloromonas sp.]|nr:general secretion pathway protein GspB [Dechloromonas sp.]